VWIGENCDLERKNLKKKIKIKNKDVVTSRYTLLKDLRRRIISFEPTNSTAGLLSVMQEEHHVRCSIKCIEKFNQFGIYTLGQYTRI
jgi:hypothetical protein